MRFSKFFAFAAVSALSAANLHAGTPTVNGVLDAAAGYTLLDTATAPGDKVGFGGAVDISAIYYTDDATHAYLFVQGRIDGSGNGILLLADTTAQTGRAAASTLKQTGGGHAFSGPGTNNWFAASEVDYGWVGNSGDGGNPNNFYVDGVDYVANAAGFRGTVVKNDAGAGTAIDLSDGTRWAFSNQGVATGLGSSTGVEVRIPKSALGNPNSTHRIRAHASIVSNSAFFSNDTAPDQFAGNAGFGATLNLTAAPGLQLPVSMSEFSIE